MIPSLLLTGLVIFLLVRHGSYEKELVKGLKKRKKVPDRIASAGLYLSGAVETFLKRHGFERIAADPEHNPLLYTKEEQTARKADRYGLVLILLFLGGIVGFVTSIPYARDRTVTTLVRPEFGEERSVELSVEKAGRKETVTVDVPSVTLSKEALEERFDDLFQALKPIWLGNNPSEEEVREPLSLTEEETGEIGIGFKSSDPSVLTDRGTILTDEIPKEGIPVTVEVTFSFGETIKTYEWPLKVCQKETAGVNQDLQEALSEAGNRNRDEKLMQLPGEVSGETVTYTSPAVSPYVIVLFTLLLAGLFWFLPKEKEKSEMKKRETELMMSYAPLVSKLATLISAGASVRSAWTRIAAGYRDDLKEGRCRRMYAYEEMLRTMHELESGSKEGEAYVRFGRRIGLHRYLKLGNVLSENLKQGISGLEKSLKEEAAEALEERKHIALKKGEEAGTKLLAPMMIMLGIVIVTLVVPAFMSF